MKYALISIAVLAIAVLLPLFLIILIEHIGKKKWKVWLKTVIVSVSAVAITLSTVLIYLNVYYHASIDLDYVSSSDSKVEMKETNDYYLFDNLDNGKDAIIFYGGAKVEEWAYSPLLSSVAEVGVDVFLMKMPFRFALLGSNKADIVMKGHDYPNVYLMGHSLGGTTASMYLSSTSYSYKGIIFLASYPSKKLNDSYKALSIYGSNDGVLNKEEYNKSLSNMPSSYEEVVIEGGNHGYFGNYGEQDGDGVASITREEQQKLTVNAISTFLSSI